MFACGSSYCTENLYHDDLLHFYFFIFLKPPRRTAVLASQKFSSTLQTIDHESDPSGEQRGKGKVSAVRFVLPMQELTSLHHGFYCHGSITSMLQKAMF